MPVTNKESLTHSISHACFEWSTTLTKRQLNTMCKTTNRLHTLWLYWKNNFTVHLDYFVCVCVCVFVNSSVDRKLFSGLTSLPWAGRHLHTQLLPLSPLRWLDDFGRVLVLVVMTRGLSLTKYKSGEPIAHF